MKVAVFYEKDRLRSYDDEIVEILIFHVADNRVMGVESAQLDNMMGEQRLNILKRYEVSSVYISEIKDDQKQSLLNHNISVITGDMLFTDKIFNSLYFSNIKNIDA